MNLPPTLQKALKSERVWIATAILIATVAAYAAGLIPAETLITSISIVAGIYIGAVTVKDGFAALLTAWLRAERYMSPDVRPQAIEEEAKKPPQGRMDVWTW